MAKRAFLLSIAAALSPILEGMPAIAGSDYCHTNARGNYMCIQSVFGPRSNRGMVFTMNGVVGSYRVNCYDYNYEKTSLIAIACWVYEP